jgi:hypothetical protein
MDVPHKPDFSPAESVASNEHTEHEQPIFNSRSRLEYLQTVMPAKKKRMWLRVLLIVLVVLFLLGGGAFAYLKFVHNGKTAPKTTTNTSKSNQTATTQPEKIVTKHFDSNNFNLGFDYPGSWVVADNNDGKLTVTSPVLKLKDSTGQTEDGQIVVTIAAKGQNLTAFDKGSGLAVRDSEKITYTKPTSVQRAQTYLSFVEYGTTTGGGIDGIFVTGDNGYKKDQYVPKVDMVKLDPVIAVTFLKCADAKCVAAPTPTSLSASIWDNLSFKNPILTTLTSLSVN